MLLYSRLPEHPLRLSVLKLDGSSFDVQVGRAASVGELHAAVEAVFGGSPKEGEGMISWSHVWSHFCLCYDGHKLIDQKMQLRTIGIKDGDQLQFVRHISMIYTPSNSHLKSPVTTCKSPYISSSETAVFEECQDNFKDLEGGNYQATPFTDDDRFQWNRDKEELSSQHTQFRLAHFLRGWLSYTRMWRRARAKAKSESKVCVSRLRRYGQRIPSRGLNV